MPRRRGDPAPLIAFIRAVNETNRGCSVGAVWPALIAGLRLPDHSGFDVRDPARIRMLRLKLLKGVEKAFRGIIRAVDQGKDFVTVLPNLPSEEFIHIQ